ncbi:hypothetical protein N7468_001455 [Penicillium chermesinum]|uniref:Myb-like DNA-binding domain-containing protein n=1 Tax=Penicillium chermesinum TaxID=63820 RepID=A0A9W9TX39_9EURO|nr:uncharacterized protein N7468_001455 [Penicillium chermesinum]KAJ5246472.1 hypothetical protein N7468_001455 [Penicillium chermesinum]KAJ6144744.1 hypothetical protein N7470_008639 [Penicillium chermesinum]
MAKLKSVPGSNQPTSKAAAAPRKAKGSISKTATKSKSKSSGAGSAGPDKDLMLLYYVVQSAGGAPDYGEVGRKLGCSRPAAQKRFARLKDRIEKAELDNSITFPNLTSAEADKTSTEDAGEPEVENAADYEDATESGDAADLGDENLLEYKDSEDGNENEDADQYKPVSEIV